MADDDMTELLHWPDRAERLDTLEQHIGIAARLARAMWLATYSTFGLEDERSVEGLRELAGAVSDHASAANYLFQNGERQ